MLEREFLLAAIRQEANHLSKEALVEKVIGLVELIEVQKDMFRQLLHQDARW